MESNLQVILQTDETKYTVPSTPISVPATSTSKELSNLIHNLLKESDTPVDSKVQFDFIIEGKFLLATLQQFLLENNINRECLEIFFIKKQQAPTQEQDINQDDFISWVARRNEFFLSSSYDATIQMYELDSEQPIFRIVNEDRIKCLDWSADNTFISGGFDQTARIWQIDMENGKVENTLTLRGHKGPLMCLKSCKDLLATGSQDCTVKIWLNSVRLDESEKSEDGLNAHKKKSKDCIPTRVPLVTFDGHKQMISSLDWLDKNQVASASWDHCIRVWDVENKKETRSIVAGFAIHAMDVSAVSGNILAGGASHGIRVYDVRASDTPLTALSANQHESSVSALAWAPHKEEHFITATVQGSVLLWDLRNAKSCLYQLKAHSQMVTCVDWAPEFKGKHSILTSSADSTIKLFNYPQ